MIVDFVRTDLGRLSFRQDGFGRGQCFGKNRSLGLFAWICLRSPFTFFHGKSSSNHYLVKKVYFFQASFPANLSSQIEQETSI